MSKFKYHKADKYLIVNDNDPDLTPVVLRLPDPPPLEKIDGYGEDPVDQRFKRVRIPPRLLRLENKVIDDLKSENINRNFVLTLYKIQKRFWEELEQKKDDYKIEIAFIKRMWYHRINGYWFFNFGKPTYITGWHFMYLNFWSMSTDTGDNHPAYRDRDRKEFLFMDYAKDTTETFKDIDDDGYAVPNEDGKYEMIDLGRRICYGVMQPKNRRSGNTNKGLSNGTEIATRTENSDAGFGIMSYSGDSASEHLTTKLTPSYKSIPIFFKPITRAINNDEIIFDVEKNEYEIEGMHSKISSATTDNPKFYDGKKLYYALIDEQGKAEYVLERWNVLKHCLSQGNGSIIHGFAYIPSTVENVSEGAGDYEFLGNQSNFYRRMRSGSTLSGIFRLFVPADEALDGYIDSYGYSVKEDILPHQEREGFDQTANDYLQSERDALLKGGTATELNALRLIKKKFPLKYADSFLGDSGDIGFDYDKIDQRTAALRREKPPRKGNFEWVSDFGGEVKFVDDPENGRFEIAWEPAPNLRNKKQVTLGYSTMEDDEVDMYAPFGHVNVVIGVDPFRWSNKREANLKGIKTGNKSRLSDGGISGYLMHDNASEGSKRREEREYGDKFILTYRSRLRNSDLFNEDVLMAAIYFRAMVYVENNVEETWKYFIKNKYGGYLIYDQDLLTGRLKEKPGVFNLEASKTRLFTGLRNYIDYRCHVEPFISFLKECKDIRGTEEMRMYDRLTAHGLALMGAESLAMGYYKEQDPQDDAYDLGNFIEYFDIG